MEPIKAIRGMNDILPPETALWQHIEQIFRAVMQSFCYEEIRFPIVEKTEIFKRIIGEATDIVEKEMYTFLDRNNESLTLRPEGTAGCVRAGIEHGLFYNQIKRLWYMGPYFRYERPQKGRYRQFHQCGAEVFGLEGPDIDAELILLAATILEKLQLRPFVRLEINSLGNSASRLHYREKLVAYLQAHYAQLDEDSQRRLTTNPLRILDSKNPALQDLLANAPKLTDYLDPESQEHFRKLQQFLQAAGVPFTINPCLVRGLDYYTKTVFEWVTETLGAQGTVCAGGRYDGLIEQLGGKPTPALGFAFGMERTLLLAQQSLTDFKAPDPQIFFITDTEAALNKAFQIAKECRDEGLRVLVHCGFGSIKNQFKKADKSHAAIALILGENELNQQAIGVKFLRKNNPQELVSLEALTGYLKAFFKQYP